jgi:hypothetical protein
MPYAAWAGALMSTALAMITFPDVAYAVGLLCLYATAPTTGHWLAAKCVLRYLAGTPSIGMIYRKGRDTAEGFGNTDYAADVDMQHGHSGSPVQTKGWGNDLQQ